MRESSAKLLVCFAFSCLLSCASVAMWVAARGAPRATGRGDLSALQQRMEVLERALRELDSVVQARVKQLPSREEAPPLERASDDLPAQVAFLEETLDALEGNLRVWMSEAATQAEEERMSRLARSILGHEALDRFRAEFLDASGGLVERLRALEMLMRFPAEMEAMKPAWPVVVALLEEHQGRSLEMVIGSVDDVEEPMILDTLVRILDEQVDDGVRHEVVRALRNHADKPAILAALERAAQGPEGKARESAQRALDRAAGR